MKKSLKYLFLSLIVLLAFFLRFYKVTDVPPSLNWDEVAIGYNAYSIMKTGKDEWGQFLPLHFKSYGEYKLPTQIYASIPGIAILGLNDLGVRITPVIYGTLSIFLIFLLAQELFGRDEISLISAFFLAISPWHIQLTRASFESSFSVFWLLIGLWLLVKGFKKPKWWIVSMIPLAITFYTYNSTRVFTPIFLVAILIIYRKKIWLHKHQLFLSVGLFTLLMLPSIPFLLNHANSRYQLVSVTDDPGLIPRVEEARNRSTLPSPIKRLIYNKEVYAGSYIIENYLAHFTPGFLFISGAPHKQHHVQGMGELYYFQFPILIFGIYLLFKRRHPFKGLLLSWLFLAFIPVSVTNDSIPNALRTLIANPFYQLVSALGLYEGYRFIRRRHIAWNLTIIGGLLIIGIIQFMAYLYNFYNIYPKLYSRDWQYGYEQVISYINQNQNKYDEIVFSRTYGEPYMFTLFYLNYNPSSYQNNPDLNRFESNNWEWVLKFGKFYFPDFTDPGTHYSDILAQNKGKKLLFIGKPGDFAKGSKILYQVNFLDNSPAFEVTDNL